MGVQSDKGKESSPLSVIILDGISPCPRKKDENVSLIDKNIPETFFFRGKALPHPVTNTKPTFCPLKKVICTSLDG